jgi:pilus assembly protein CpaF
MFAIVVNEKGGEQKRLEFDKPEVTIGRVQGNDIILPKGNVSKRHSRIVLKDGKFIIVDLKSTNGTYVNGRKITSPLVVKSSDKIYIGDFILSIEDLAGAGASDEPAPTAPPRAKQPSMPPPPPRRAPAPEPGYDEEPAAEAAGDDAGDDDELPPPEPPRPARPSTPAVAPSPLAAAAAPAARITAPREAVRPPSSQRDLPASPAPRPSAAPPPAASRPASVPAPMMPAPPRAPAPTPAAVARPTPAAVPAQAPARKPVSAPTPSVDDAKRNKITEVMRELGTRLAASLGLDSRGADATAEEDVWTRAERTASDLLEQLNADGVVPGGVDTEQLLRDVVSETVGVGPFEELLSDESVREVAVPRHDRVYVDRGGQRQIAPRWFSSSDAVTRAVERLVARAGRTGDLTAARANGALVEVRIEGGLLLTAALPPLAARGPSLTIRRPRRNLSRIGDLVGEGFLSQGMADFLELAVKARKNIVIAGPAGSGRSTVLAALARAAADERVVSVEEAEELELGDGAWMPLIGRGPQARQAISYALRLRPERLVVGDVRGAEALDLVAAMAGGQDGVMSVVQASSPRDALMRLESMARLAPEAPTAAALGGEMGRAVQVIVQLARTAEGELRVAEIAEVLPGEGAAACHTVFTYKPDAAGGRFAATGHVPSWAEGAPPSTFRA